MNPLVTRMQVLLEDVKNCETRRVKDPNMLVPTLLIIDEVISKIERGESIESGVNLIEKDVRALLAV